MSASRCTAKIAILYVLLPVFTWLFFFHSFLPHVRDNLPDLGDSIHNSWIMAHSAPALLTCGTSCLYQSNIYYPRKNTGAYAETLIAESMLFSPIFLLSGNPQIAFNAVTAGNFIFTMASAIFLFRLLGAGVFASCLFALAFTYLPFRIPHIPHTQLLSMHLVILPLAFLIGYLKKRGWFWLIGFLIFLFIKGCSFGYNAFLLYLFILLVSGCWFLLQLSRFRSGTARWREGFIAAIGTAIVFVINLLLFYMPYLHAAIEGNTRDLATVNFYAADILYLISAPQANYLYGPLTESIRKLDLNGQISALFMGLTPVFLLVYALGRLRGRLSSEDETLQIRSEAVVFLAAFAIMLLISLALILGPYLKFNGAVIATNYPFMGLWHIGLGRFTRYTPAFIQALVLSLCAIGALLYSLRSRETVLDRILLSFLVVFALIEYRFKPPSQVWHYTNQNLPALYRALAKETLPQGPILELPIQTGYSPAAEYYNEQMIYMYFSIFHKRAMINGQSGFFPEEFVRNSAVLATFPSDTAVALLRQLKIPLVLLHKGRYLGGLGEEKLQASLRNPALEVVFQDEKSGDFAFKVH